MPEPQAPNPDPTLTPPGASGAPDPTTLTPAVAESGQVTPPQTAAAPTVSGDVTPDSGENLDGGSPPSPTPTEPKPAPPKADWRDDRIRVLRAKLADAQRQLDAAKSPQSNVAAPPGATREEIDRLVQQELNLRLFNERSTATVSDGKRQFGDEFLQRVNGLKAMVEQTDPSEVAAYNRVLTTAMETEAGARVLYELGGNQERAMEVLELARTNPTKLAIELAKMAAAPQEPAPSGAPKPITLVGQRGGARVEIDPTDPTRADNLDTAAWMARRQAQIKAQREARGR